MSKIAFVFPGQGAQYIGMGKEIIQQDKDSREIFDKANKILDFDLEEVCFTEQKNINITEYTQPALLAVSIAILKVVEKIGIKPDYVAGLSLGEYSALVANGALDFEVAVDLVRKRGQYMEEAARSTVGGMAAILGSKKEIIKEICDQVDGIVDIANYNSPKQFVISGEMKALNQAISRLEELNIKVIPLKVSGAFHSLLMKEAANKLENYLENVTINEMSIPYYTNVTGEMIRTTESVKNLLVNQVFSSVRWEQDINNMIEQGVDTFIEIGPGKTLSGLIRKIDRKKKVMNVQDLDSLNKLKQYLEG